ncbi:PhoH family protein [Sandaracinus amylolyticus]|uniref:PhoH family protein n=1 Tax=Sandaracinus amylolyticus TaxID=927083 RepID=UPI001F4620BE|nr:PhoH family protein [Sandaracinus amylolyticus]UJR78338.1 Phosphate starvation-inducible protein PhoH [Sandaracinus amylolyticus]
MRASARELRDLAGPFWIGDDVLASASRMAQTTPRESANEDNIHAEVEVDEPDLLVRLTGPGANHLDILESEFEITAGVRGNTIHLRGTREAVENAERALMEILSMLEKNKGFSEREVERSIRTLKANPEVRLGDFMNDVVLATPRRTITAKGPTQHGYVQQMRENDIVFGIGPAGTGKTYLAMAMAVRALLEKRVKRIVLTRPAVEAGEKLGFLPGDLAEKVNPYLRPLYDALHDMMDMERAQMLVQRGVIEVAPLAFMRGRTLNDAFVILDEAQNSTSDQMRMFLTRLGFGSKAVVTGDVTQVDLPSGARSGLADATRVLDRVPGIAFTYFSDADVVRHPLVARIVRAYEARDAARERAKAEREALAEMEAEGMSDAGSREGTVGPADDQR